MTLTRARFGVLGQPAFRRLFVGQAVSALGDRLVTVALAFAVLDLTGSVGDLGVVLAAQTVPLVVMVLFGGVWSDRLPPRMVMLTSDLVRALAQGASAALLLAGVAHIWELAALQALYGGAKAFFVPAATAVVPQVVVPEDLQSANSIMGMSVNVAEVVGPAIAGVLVATAGAGWGLGADAATFVVSAASLARLHVARSASEARSTTWAELRAGWDSFRSRRWLWVSVVFFGLYAAFVLGPLQVLGPQLARTSLGGPGAWGAISASFGIGSLVGAATALRWRPSHPLRAAFLLGLLGSPALLGLLALAAPLSATIIGAVAFGVTETLFTTLWLTTVQREIPAAELARVSSWDYLGTLTLSPVGLLLAGPIALAIGIHVTLAAAASLVIVLTLIVISIPEVRNHAGPEAGVREADLRANAVDL